MVTVSPSAGNDLCSHLIREKPRASSSRQSLLTIGGPAEAAAVGASLAPSVLFSQTSWQGFSEQPHLTGVPVRARARPSTQGA